MEGWRGGGVEGWRGGGVEGEQKLKTSEKDTKQKMRQNLIVFKLIFFSYLVFASSNCD